MKALSIQQPWATAIIHFGKDIENRTWRTKYRGRFLVHASKGVDLEAPLWVWELYIKKYVGRGYNSAKHRPSGNTIPIYHQSIGGIIGSVNLSDCVDSSDSKWYSPHPEKQIYGFVLDKPEPMDFIPYKGKLSFFEVENIC